MVRILLIDDDDLLRSALSKILELAGYEVVSAADGVEGMEQFKDTDFDVVVTDMFMPEKKGFDVISEIRAIRKEIGIIAMSGRDTLNRSTILRYAKELGADDCLRKPCDREELLKLIKELVELRKNRRR